MKLDMRTTRTNANRRKNKTAPELLAAPMRELFWAQPDFGLLDNARERLERALSDALSQSLASVPSFETFEQDLVLVAHQGSDSSTNSPII
jgi:hypothetical protein